MYVPEKVKMRGLKAMSADDVSAVLNMAGMGFCLYDMAECLNVHQTTARRILNFYGVDYAKKVWGPKPSLMHSMV